MISVYPPYLAQLNHCRTVGANLVYACVKKSTNIERYCKFTKFSML